MALTRREFLCAVPLCTGMVWSCATQPSLETRPNRLVEVANSKTTSQVGRTILVCMPETAPTKEVWKGLSDELSHDYRLVAKATQY